MKNIFLFVLCLVLFSACSEDFKVGADYKEVTIIYGLLDDGSSNNKNYVKITRGFFSEKENNLLQAQIADSLYFNDLSVQVQELSNGSVQNTFTLNKVDLDTVLADAKQEGVFLVSPNIAYELDANLNPNNSYKIIVTNNESGKVVTGETEVISAEDNQFRVNYPNPLQFDQLDFANPLSVLTFEWIAPSEAVLYDIVLRFYYWEEDITTQVEVNKFVDLPLGKFIPRTGGTMNYRFDNELFYSLLTSNIGAGGTNIRRFVDTPQLRFVGGGDELKNI